MKPPHCKRPADESEPRAQRLGGCLASAKIVSDGLPVVFMVRVLPDYCADSGWRFLASGESLEELEQCTPRQVYEVQTIALLDRAIAPHLTAPFGAAFERSPSGNTFVRACDWKLDEEEG